MIARRSFFSIVLAAVLFFGTVHVAASAAKADHVGQTAKQFIEDLAEEAISALTDKDATRNESIDRFRSLLGHNFNVPLIAKWVMGRHWRIASDGEKAEYMGLFEDLIVITYVDQIGRAQV